VLLRRGGGPARSWRASLPCRVGGRRSAQRGGPVHPFERLRLAVSSVGGEGQQRVFAGRQRVGEPDFRALRGRPARRRDARAGRRAGSRRSPRGSSGHQASLHHASGGRIGAVTARRGAGQSDRECPMVGTQRSPSRADRLTTPEHPVDEVSDAPSEIPFDIRLRQRRLGRDGEGHRASPSRFDSDHSAAKRLQLMCERSASRSEVGNSARAIPTDTRDEVDYGGRRVWRAPRVIERSRLEPSRRSRIGRHQTAFRSAPLPHPRRYGRVPLPGDAIVHRMCGLRGGGVRWANEPREVSLRSVWF
jgi:hypothetical protein